MTRVNITVNGKNRGWVFQEKVVEIPVIKAAKFKLTQNKLTSRKPLSKVADIWCIGRGQGFRLSVILDVPPELEAKLAGQPIILIAEKLLDAKTTEKDVRFQALIVGKQLQLRSKSGFVESGNYAIRAQRQNEGLKRTKVAYRFEFDTVEFNVIQA